MSEEMTNESEEPFVSDDISRNATIVEEKLDVVEVDASFADNEIKEEITSKNYPLSETRNITDVTEQISYLIDKVEGFRVSTKETKGVQVFTSMPDEALIELVKFIIQTKAALNVANCDPKSKEKAFSQAKSYFNKNFPKKINGFVLRLFPGKEV